MKKVIYINASAFFLLVLAAVYITDKLNPSFITTAPYQFIEKFFSQWSLALSAAGTIILALMLFFNIYENRRREELQNRQAIYALHDEIHWNMRPIITIRFDISERLSYINEHHVKPSEPAPFQLLETRVFDELRNQGQLHLLESLRMDAVFCYGIIDTYNRDGRFKPNHLEILTTLHERLDKLIRNLEANFKFLPKYVRYDNKEDKENKLPKENEFEKENNEKNVESTKEEKDIMSYLIAETKLKLRNLKVTLLGLSILLILFIAWVTYNYWTGNYGNVSHVTSLLIGGLFYSFCGALITTYFTFSKNTTIAKMSIAKSDGNPTFFYELMKFKLATRVGLSFITFGFLVQASAIIINDVLSL